MQNKLPKYLLILGLFLTFALILSSFFYIRARYPRSTLGRILNTNITDLATISGPKIQVYSHLNGYSVQAKTTLEKELQDLGYWNKNGLFLNTGLNNKVTAKKLVVNIWPISSERTKSAYYVQGSANGDYLTIGHKVGVTGVDQIDIGLSNDIISGKGGGPIKWINNAFWNAIYMGTKHAGVSTVDRDARSRFKSQQIKKGVFFEIK